MAGPFFEPRPRRPPLHFTTSGVVCPHLWTNYPRGRFSYFLKKTVDDLIRLRKNLMTQRKKRKRNCGGSRPQEVRNEKNEL